MEVWFEEFAESPPVAAMVLVQGEEVVELMHYRAGSMAPHSIKVARLQVTRWLEVGTVQGAEAVAKVWCSHCFDL